MRVVFDFCRLRGRIVEKYGTYANFAKTVGITKGMLSTKLNNKTRITSDEIIQWSAPDKLDICTADIPAYFLTPKV